MWLSIVLTDCLAIRPRLVLERHLLDVPPWPWAGSGAAATEGTATAPDLASLDFEACLLRNVTRQRKASVLRG